MSYAIETTEDESSESLVRTVKGDPPRYTLDTLLTIDHGRWKQRTIEETQADACRTAQRIRDEGRNNGGARPVVRVRGLTGDDKGRTILIMQRIRYRHE